MYLRRNLTKKTKVFLLGFIHHWNLIFFGFPSFKLWHQKILQKDDRLPSTINLNCPYFAFAPDQCIYYSRKVEISSHAHWTKCIIANKCKCDMSCFFLSVLGHLYIVFPLIVSLLLVSYGRRGNEIFNTAWTLGEKGFVSFFLDEIFRENAFSFSWDIGLQYIGFPLIPNPLDISMLRFG